jgi:diaminopimelate decarboxylase
MSSTVATYFLPPGFSYRNGELFCEEVSLRRLVNLFGTPLYVYSLNQIQRVIARYTASFQGVQVLFAYAVKANDTRAILQLVAQNRWGFDIVSGGEYLRARSAGAPPDTIVFSGVGKTAQELSLALEEGVYCLNIESEGEADLLLTLSPGGSRPIPAAIRVNPEIDTNTHPHIRTGYRGSKFGLPWKTAFSLYRRLKGEKGIRIAGIATHIGSQILELEPFRQALEKLLSYADDLKRNGIEISHIDLGGGVGIPYRAEDPIFPLEEYGEAVKKIFPSSLHLVLEPGRSVVGNAGVLLTSVLYRKPLEERTYLIVDTAMTELIRPMLYGAYHAVAPLEERPPEEIVDLAGPVCESTDILARDRPLPHLKLGDVVAILSAGAYGSVMSSNYNTRPRPAEIVVDGNRFALAKPRERYSDLILRDEIFLNWQV